VASPNGQLLPFIFCFIFSHTNKGDCGDTEKTATTIILLLGERYRLIFLWGVAMGGVGEGGWRGEGRAKVTKTSLRWKTDLLLWLNFRYRYFQFFLCKSFLKTIDLVCSSDDWRSLIFTGNPEWLGWCFPGSQSSNTSKAAKRWTGRRGLPHTSFRFNSRKIFLARNNMKGATLLDSSQELSPFSKQLTEGLIFSFFLINRILRGDPLRWFLLTSVWEEGRFSQLHAVYCCRQSGLTSLQILFVAVLTDKLPNHLRSGVPSLHQEKEQNGLWTLSKLIT